MPSPRDIDTPNPFWVLDATASMSRGDIERQGQKLLALLALAAPGSARYQTPLGPRTRTADDVRAALADLRDPSLRLRWEVVTQTVAASDHTLAAGENSPPSPKDPRNPAEQPVGWTEALAEAGWRR